MLKVGDTIKIHSDHFDKVFYDYNINNKHKKFFNKKILNSNFTVVSLFPMHNDKNGIIFDARSNINNKSIILYDYEVINITRLIKLKKLMECSK